MRLIRFILLSLVAFSVLFATDYYTVNGVVSNPVLTTGLDSVLLKLFTPDSVFQDSTFSDDGNYSLTMTITATDPLDIPSGFNVSAYPNPVNPSLRISFTIPKPGNYAIESFDLRGRKLTNYKKYFNVGSYSIAYGGANTASGMQIVRVSGEGYNKAVKITFLDGGDGRGFEGISKNNVLRKTFAKKTDALEVILTAEKEGYEPYETLLTLYPENNVYNFKLDKKRIQKNNMLAITVKCIKDSILTSRIAIVDYNDFSNYIFITPDSINAIQAKFSPNKEKILITYDSGGLDAFCIYDIRTDIIDHLTYVDYIKAWPVSGVEPVWDLNGEGFYYSNDRRMGVLYYNLFSREINTIYYESGVSAYPIAVMDSDSLIVFSNKFYWERNDNYCFFVMAKNGEYGSQIKNPHLELINIDGINIKAAYDLNYCDSLDRFVFAAYDSTFENEFRIATTNYYGSEYMEYTQSNEDSYPMWGPEDIIYYNSKNKITGYIDIYSINMNTFVTMNLSEKIIIPNMIYAMYPNY